MRLLDSSGKIVDTKQVTAADEWKYTFDNLPKDSYRLEEVLPEGYLVSYQGYNIINTKIPENPAPLNKDFVGQKAWVGDKDTDRPQSIVIHLVDVATNQIVAATEANIHTGWKYEFKNIPIIDENGKVHQYRVVEVVPEGYQVSYSGMNITNTKIPKTPPVTPPDKPICPNPCPKPCPIPYDPCKPCPECPGTPGTPPGTPGTPGIPNMPSKPSSTGTSGGSSGGSGLSGSTLPTKPTRPSYPSKTNSGVNGITSNPKTYVEGYAPHILAIISTGLAMVYADMKRRKKF